MHAIKTEVVILGGGPGGFSAAFRAAALGKNVVLIEQQNNLGGTCLHAGCIPSKALLHAAHIVEETQQFNNNGISFAPPKIDLKKINAWKNSIINRLAMGLESLAKQQKLQVIRGSGKFTNPHQIIVITAENTYKIDFERAIIATGSIPNQLLNIPNDPRILDSTSALNFTEIPQEMLIIGGGVIGLEMATIYCSFGSKITIVEATEQLLPNIDSDIVKQWQQYNTKKIPQILLSTTVSSVETKKDGVWVTFTGKNTSPAPYRFDNILIATGRQPNSKLIALEKAGIIADKHGFITVNSQFKTNTDHIFAIGDVIGSPMLAHKAMREGKHVAEILSDCNYLSGDQLIPCAIYTTPEIASVGLTEKEAKKQNISYKTSSFPWLANGRALSIGRKGGLTKLLFDPNSNKIIGGSIIGPNASELIAEITLAIALEATADKIAHIIHPHPTLSETITAAAENHIN